jgi:hypothetical protein
MGVQIKVTDRRAEVKEELEAACLRALEQCGFAAEGYAKYLAPVDTGRLRNDISHRVDPATNTVYVGTNVEYAVYQEFGTGKYYEGGTPKPWTYTDAKGNQHWTGGNRAKPFIKPAVADHVDTYRKIIERELKGR